MPCPLTRHMQEKIMGHLPKTDETEARVTQHSKYAWIEAVPYAGPATSGVILAVTGEVSRFSNSRKYVAYTLLLSPVIPSDRRESRNLLSESHLPSQVEIPRFATLTRNDVPGEPE